MVGQLGAILTDPSALTVELKRHESLRRDALFLSLGTQPEYARRQSGLELRDALIALCFLHVGFVDGYFRSFFQRGAQPI